MNRISGPSSKLLSDVLRAASRTLAAVGILGLAAASAWSATGKVRGKIVAHDTGEAMSFVNVALVPADTTLPRVGGLTNSDGTFEMLAAEGVYTLRLRQMAYAQKSVTGLQITAAKPFDLGTVALVPEAIQLTEVVVEARAIQGSESALLSQRRKASTVQDAVSAEQVRKSPDRDAGDVLRRVTGVSVNDGKYVFVRGLGERYSSTEVDGVRLASPEMNRRVVPLDLIPAALLEAITVQKTYTADRPAEFGGGDVQVKTKDFPGRRTLSLTAGQSIDEGTTFERVLADDGSVKDVWALGASDRDFPALFRQQAKHQKVIQRGSLPGQTGFSAQEIAALGRSFSNRWAPTSQRAGLNENFSLVYGDEWKLGGRALGFITSGTYGRSFNDQDERQRYFVGQTLTGGSADVPRFDLGVRRSTETVQLSGQAKMSLRIAPSHSLHASTFYNRSAEDEARLYQGFSEDIQDSIRSNRLRYTERSILNAGIEGRHEFPQFFASRLEWKMNRSVATQDVPDEREARYQRYASYDDYDSLITSWTLRPGRAATSKFRAMKENGRGMELALSAPFSFLRFGNGKATLGLSDQWKNRSFLYRKLNFIPANGAGSAPPESLFLPGEWTGQPGGARLEEYTLPGDNYDAEQGQTAGYLSADLPFGPRLRTSLGARLEYGVQQLRAFDLFDPFSTATTELGRIEHTDLLPSANLTWNVRDDLNFRLGASRTLSRPDIAEMSPARYEDYVPGFRDMPGFTFTGNPKLERAIIENLDARVEMFPSLSEVIAVGVFTKRLNGPIELSANGGTEPIFTPINSRDGRNAGLELEYRSGLGRYWPRLRGLSINANASWISSRVRLPEQTTVLVRREHPLQGQADRLWNVGLGWASPEGRYDATVLVSNVGRKLAVVGFDPAPDFYDEPVTRLDATINVKAVSNLRLKLAGANLTDAATIVKQGPAEALRYRSGRSYSLSLALGQ